MQIPEYITKVELERVCRELGLRDWTQLNEPAVCRRGRNDPGGGGGETLAISLEQFRQGSKWESSMASAFPTPTSPTTIRCSPARSCSPTEGDAGLLPAPGGSRDRGRHAQGAA